tara:strand:- start:952 stop:1518 length:567 start_codon:yes stop_codon:yes gene_type:complete
MTRPLPAIGISLILVGLTTACDDRQPEPAGPAPAPTSAPDVESEAPPATSIIRPSVLAEIAPEPEPVPDPVETRVLFDYGSADLSEAARARLDAVLATEGLVADGWTLTLTGRTDSRGGTQANQRMARERAAAVRDYLVERGVAAGQVTTIAAGEVDPAPDQATTDASEARRVDVLATPGGDSATGTE